MRGYSQEEGLRSAKANVFARDGTYFYEIKVIAISEEKGEKPSEALIATEGKKGLSREDTCRGSVRVGFSRREFSPQNSVGSNAYGYGVALFGNNIKEYGNVRFNSRCSMVVPTNPGPLKAGDVVGLMITLPPISLHQKVVRGTYDHAVDGPHLSYGPYIPPKKKAAAKGSAKRAGKAKAPADPNTDPADSEVASSSAPVRPSVLDIIRDRAIFENKGKVYYETPQYSPHRDLNSSAGGGRGKTINPETGRAVDPNTEAHPNHELPHLRTLPGSKIEMWVNGKYQGVVMENLLAFLPPASVMQTSKGVGVSGEIDDGTLGYYPTISCYGGGAATCKFDEPFDFPPKDRIYEAIGKRYNIQIGDDVADDMVDEVTWEKVQGQMGIPPQNAPAAGEDL